MGRIFGPVPSRRLGRSLGVDLVPFKTCSYDCIYCQLGRTTNKTIERRQWVPLDEVLAELKDKLTARPDSNPRQGKTYSKADRAITDENRKWLQTSPQNYRLIWPRSSVSGRVYPSGNQGTLAGLVDGPWGRRAQSCRDS